MAFDPHGFGTHKSSFVNGLQLTNGSPVMSLGQLQTGVSPLNSQFALIPQDPSHGFLHIP